MKQKHKKYAMVTIGLFAIAGFPMAMFTYSSLVNTSAPQQQQDREDLSEVQLPASQFSNDKYELTLQQQGYLAANNQKVFVNAYYRTQQEKDAINSLQPLSNSSVFYVNKVNLSENTPPVQANLTSGRSLLVGDNPSRALAAANSNPDSVRNAACTVMRNPSRLAAYCFG